jgi:hypothetical protein
MTTPPPLQDVPENLRKETTAIPPREGRDVLEGRRLVLIRKVGGPSNGKVWLTSKRTAAVVVKTGRYEYVEERCTTSGGDR